MSELTSSKRCGSLQERNVTQITSLLMLLYSFCLALLFIGCATDSLDTTPFLSRAEEILKVREVVMDPRWESDGLHVTAYAIAESRLIEYTRKNISTTQVTNLSQSVVRDMSVWKVPLYGGILECRIAGASNFCDRKAINDEHEAVFPMKVSDTRYVDVSLKLVDVSTVHLKDHLSAFTQKTICGRIPVGRKCNTPLVVPDWTLESLVVVDTGAEPNMAKQVLYALDELRYFTFVDGKDTEMKIQEALIRREGLFENESEVKRLCPLLKADNLLLIKGDNKGLFAKLIRAKDGKLISAVDPSGEMTASDIPLAMERACAEYAGQVLGKTNADFSRFTETPWFEMPMPKHDWRSPSTGMEFVWIPALKIWVGKYEVTNGEYHKMYPLHDSGEFNNVSLNGDRQPVAFVDFDDAKAYAAWLTERDRAHLSSLRYRVISDEEWQSCAQCGDSRTYPWGNNMPPKYGIYLSSENKSVYRIYGYKNEYVGSCPVEKSGANDWGLYGVGGNVWECCASDQSGTSFGHWRGASWVDFNPDYLRCAFRLGHYDGYRFALSLGFRLVLSR